MSSTYPSGGVLATPLSRDDGACPGPILDHEGFAEPLLQLLREHAGDDVGASARREGHDDRDGARRIVLCPRQRRSEKPRNGGPSQTQESTTAELHGMSPSSASTPLKS